MPFDDTITSLGLYNQPRPFPTYMIVESEKWSTTHDYKHQWVFTGQHDLKEKQARLMQALRSSPLGVSVYAWKEKDGLYIKPEGAQDQHWTVCFGYEEGAYWLIFDSYPPYIKKLAWDFDFGFAKQYTIEKKPIIIPVPKRSFFSFLGLDKWFPNPQPFICPSA